MQAKTRLFLIGVGSQGLTGEQTGMLARCGLIVGDRRHLAQVAEMAGEKQAISPLAPALERIRLALVAGDVGVLASGDPLFFGIGRRLLHEFLGRHLAVFPPPRFRLRAKEGGGPPGGARNGPTSRSVPR